MKVTEVVEAWGHENVLSTHKSTFEITREKDITKRGDCIIAVRSSKGASDISSKFKQFVKKKGVKIMISIECDKFSEKINAEGSPFLSFVDDTDLIVRKSSYVCGRTIAINADKAAIDLSRQLIRKLQHSTQKIQIYFIAYKNEFV